MTSARSAFRLSLPLAQGGDLLAGRHRPPRRNLVGRTAVRGCARPRLHVDLRRRRDHDGTHLLAAHRIVDPDHHALRHVGELFDHRLDLQRRHVRPSGLDQFAGAADVEQARVAVPAVDPVAGVIPAVLVERLGRVRACCSPPSPRCRGREARRRCRREPARRPSSTMLISVNANPPAVSDMVRCTGNPSGTSVIAMSSGPSRSIGALDRSRSANVGCSRSRCVNAGHPTMPGGPLALDQIQRRLGVESRHDEERDGLVQRPRRGEHPADPEERHRAQDPGRSRATR